MPTYLQHIANRRSVYNISSESPITDQRIEELLKHNILNAPTAFNSQSSRAVLLLGENHKKLWSIVLETLRKKVKPEKFAATEEKIASFAAGHGTILYFNDDAVTEQYAKEYPSYTQHFPSWAQQQNGMLQFAMWTTLEAEGLGASLQHYNPIIDDEVKQTWNLPQSWKLYAQMPFGKPTARPQPKEFSPVEERVRIFK